MLIIKLKVIKPRDGKNTYENTIMPKITNLKEYLLIKEL